MRRYARPQLETPAATAAAGLLTPPRRDLERIFLTKYGDVETCGWSPRMRHRFGYLIPDDEYEALVDQLVRDRTVWLGAGCGRFLFPGNARLAQQLSKRAAHLVGVDPDETLDENPFVHEKARVLIDDYRTFANSRLFQWLELGTWRLLRTVGLHYPEVCLLAVYTRQ